MNPKPKAPKKLKTFANGFTGKGNNKPVKKRAYKPGALSYFSKLGA